ncbi:exodeoxyribonuclease VII large subunit [Brevibacterium litoralis]|uniref:exodeoxyribonuclease VII large subunit n=1 Tax=Brevibacterium litoralis TaxID=3138935 RepID=UPI003D9A5E14
MSLLSRNIKAYVEKMSSVWVEGQVVEFNRRAKASYLTLRDIDEEMSLPLQIWANVLDRMESPVEQGSRVVVRVKPNFWLKAGRMSMQASDIRAVGLGDLLARLEKLRRTLGAEGLFDPSLKKPLPFLPHRIGLITGRDSDAEKDVMRNAGLRWPAVQFEVRNVAVQGVDAVPQVRRAFAELDAMESVDVIVIARGGGSFEDLLPFSNEALIRDVWQARTPVVSAIGHEADRPILDEVVDMRASTPTDAAKRIVPDIAEERMGVLQARANLDGAIDRLLKRESDALAAVRSRPVLAEPGSMITVREQDLHTLRSRSWQAGSAAVDRGAAQIAHLRAQVRSLSPRATLARGYAVVQTADGAAVRDTTQVEQGSTVHVRVENGRFDATVTTVDRSGEDT